MLSTATTLPEPHAPSSWPWVEVGKIRRLRMPRYELPINGLAESMVGLRIVHLSDLHIHQTWMPGWDRLHEWLRGSPPDVVVITGDWVDQKHDHRPAIAMLKRFLDGLTARLGVWGILGNHDTDLLPLRAGEMPVRTLCNESTILKQGDAELELIGLHGVHPHDSDQQVIEGLLSNNPAGRVRVVLSHFPGRVLSLAGLGVDLVLSGHTHGGQVCLPGGIPIMTHDHLPRRFARGVHRIDKTWLVTSRGCGFSKFALRVFCPAEAIEIELVRDFRL